MRNVLGTLVLIVLALAAIQLLGFAVTGALTTVINTAADFLGDLVAAVLGRS